MTDAAPETMRPARRPWRKDGVLHADLCIIGAGSAGLSVAAGAAQMGAAVVLIERDRMGGDCLNTGCVPSKALIAAAHAAEAMRGGSRFGVTGAAPEIAETLRLVLGWAWTYVIVAELIGSSSGIGHMITDSQSLLNTGQIIFGIIIIGLIGLVSDFAFKALNHRLFAWSFVR